MHKACLILHTDGAARGNPGPAGAGAVIQSVDGEVCASVCKYLGETTNNQAEYRALELALAEAEKLGGKKLVIKADSELMVKQLKGEYRVKNPGIREIFDEVKNRLASFDEWKVEHVRREYNREADALANEAIDKHFKR